jgi:hypothetical protein
MVKRKNQASQDCTGHFDLSAEKLVHQQNLLDDVVTIDTLQAGNPDLFTKPQLNWLLKTRHKNGLDQLGAVLKISRKLYVRKSIFIDWFLKQKASDS